MRYMLKCEGASIPRPRDDSSWSILVFFGIGGIALDAIAWVFEWCSRKHFSLTSVWHLFFVSHMSASPELGTGSVTYSSGRVFILYHIGRFLSVGMRSVNCTLELRYLVSHTSIPLTVALHLHF